eukprot:Awhi_evm1s1739
MKSNVISVVVLAYCVSYFANGMAVDSPAVKKSSESKKIAINTCGEYFASVGDHVCHEYGYANRRGGRVICKGDCEAETCCKREWKTCGDFFSSEGKDYCVKNGYANRRDHSTKCSMNLEYGCGEIKTCCKNQHKPLTIKTC